MSHYTEHAEELLYQFDESEQLDCDYQGVLDVLNSEFRTFGEALAEFINRAMPSDCELSAVDYLKKKSAEKGIKIASYNTFSNWFQKGLRPKKSEQSREMVFKIAFALDMNEQETINLFHKVYLDRAFNYRSYKELIYYFCIRKHLSWADAQAAIALINTVSLDEKDQTLHTLDIATDLESIADISGVVQYVTGHPHNFLLNNVTAKERLQYYLQSALRNAERESAGSQTGEYYKNMNRNSVNFLFSVMTDCNMNGKSGTKPISFKGKELPQEIKNNFPNPSILSDDNPSHEEIRKTFILLYSYDFWYKLRENPSYNAFDDYYAGVNYELNLMGYPELYFGNPYDWLFLYCAFSESPLDTFRDILAAVLEQ